MIFAGGRQQRAPRLQLPHSQRDSPPPLAYARRPVDHDADLARSPVRPLANRRTAARVEGPASTPAGSVRSAGLAGRRAVPDDERRTAWSAIAPLGVGISGAEC